MSFWGELRRRNVFKVGAAYAVLAWLVIQVANNFFPNLGLPPWTQTLVAVLILFGFPFALLLAWIYEITPEGVKRTDQVAPEASARQVTGHRLNYLVIGLLFLNLAFIAVDNHFDDRAPAGAETQPSQMASFRNASDEPSVAVLPFENLSPNLDDAYFAVGIHEQVLARLGKIGGLTVMARPSVLRYENASWAEAARDLKVGAIGGGTVRYADGNVIVTAFLSDAATGAQLWSETYTRPLENIFAIETDLATEIAVALEAELAPSERRNLEKVPTRSAEAYTHFLRAISALPNPVGGLGVSSEESAEFYRHLDRALEADPEFALAYAAKARDYAYSMGRFIPRAAGLSFEDRATIAMTNAERALSLDAETGLAYAALSTMHRLSGRSQEAQVALEQALALSPNDFQVLSDAVLLNVARSNPAAAMDFAQRAARINPVDGYVLLGIAFRAAGDYDAAAEQFASRPDVPGNNIELAFIGLLRRDTATVVRNLGELERRGIRGPASIPNVAYLYHLVGADDDARRVAATFERFAADYAVGSGDWALAALSTGDNAGALQWLERAAARPTIGPGWQSTRIIARNGFSDPVLERPEFVEVRKRLPQ